MSGALVVVESGLDPQALVTLARGAAERVSVLSLDASGGLVGESDAEEVLSARVDPFDVDAVAEVVASLVRERGSTVVVLAASAHLREVMGLLSVRLGAACVADAMALRAVDGEVQADRLLYGGVVVATVALARSVAVVSARTGRAEGAVAGTPIEVASAPPRRALLSRTVASHQSALPAASRVVSFGRGVRGRDDVVLIERLAELLDAELGCSRPVVEDLRWLGVEHQVGLTGTTVTPDLYVAVGISGQIQHLVGMRDSKMIVAINNTATAPIFSVADVGVVGDLYEVVPRLIEALGARAG